MTSMLYDKQKGGHVDVYADDFVEELIIDSQDQIKTMYVNHGQAVAKRTKLKRPYSTPNPIYRSSINIKSNVDPDALIGHTLKLQDWLNERSIKNLQDKADINARKTRQLYEDVLQTENSFVKEMEHLVKYKEMLDLRKKEILHKRWSDRVYQPIRKQVVKEANSPEFIELFKRKRELHKEYLEFVNKKGHVFLETIDPSEYYPMSLNPVRPGAITAVTKNLKDPLLTQERERCNEDRIIFQCEIGSNLTDHDIQQIRLPPLPMVPLGRHGTVATTWVAMPMGDIESPVRQASRRRMRGNFCQSEIKFDHVYQSPLSRTNVLELKALEQESMDTHHSSPKQIHNSVLQTNKPPCSVMA